MNLIGSYRSHQHLIHEASSFAPRCYQNNPYLLSWLMHNGEQHHSDLQLHASTNWTEFGEPATTDHQDSFSAQMAKARRTITPKKERRRTENINIAFSELRDCIPNVPSDTKLSKIKTLKLATSYIAYLMSILANGTAADGFKAELQINTDFKRKRELRDVVKNEDKTDECCREKKVKGRTGWPQQVWAHELNP